MDLELDYRKRQRNLYKYYRRRQEELRQESIQAHLIEALAARIERLMPGCSTSNGDTSMLVYLNKDQNIEKDWAICHEAVQDLCNTIGKGTYESTIDMICKTVDFKYPKFTIYVSFGNSESCKLEKIGEETVTKPIYELRCN